MKSKIMMLKCLTNLHVGNGDVNYNIVDNEVEKDPVLGYPTIHSTGVKGALREYLKGSVDETKLNAVFGGSESQGQVKILAAEMLALPMRASGGNAAYYLVTTDEAIERFCSLYESFGCGEVTRTYADVSGAAAEGVELTRSVVLEGICDTPLYLMKDSAFRNISLPIIARNKLDNGISKNLWYEEYVSHESLFYFAALAEDSADEAMNCLLGQIKDKIVQFGGNASVGYGLCKVSVIGENHE